MVFTIAEYMHAVLASSISENLQSEQEYHTRNKSTF